MQKPFQEKKEKSRGTQGKGFKVGVDMREM